MRSVIFSEFANPTYSRAENARVPNPGRVPSLRMLGWKMYLIYYYCLPQALYTMSQYVWSGRNANDTNFIDSRFGSVYLVVFGSIPLLKTG